MNRGLRMKKDNMTVIFKSTCNCNINCPYCYDKHQREKYKSLACTPEIIKHTIDLSAKHSNNVEFIWHGGESTTLPQSYFQDAQPYFFENYDTNFTQIMQSNGVNVVKDHSWLTVLDDLGITLGLSFDAYSQAIRTGSPEEQTKIMDDYLEILLENERLTGDGSCITVIHKKNIDKLIQTYEYFKTNIKHSDMNFNFVVEAWGNSEHGLALSSEEYYRYWKPFLAYVVYDIDDLATTERTASTYIDLYINHPRFGLCTHTDCRKLWIGIQPNGDVTYCDRELNDKYYIGSVLNYDSIDEIHNSKGYQAILDDIDYRIKNECGKCDMFKYCKGGCHSNHAAPNNGLVNKCDRARCDEFKASMLITIDTLSDIDINTELNYNYLRKILESPTLIYCEIKYFLDKLGYTCLPLTELLSLGEDSATESNLYKLLQCFRGEESDIRKIKLNSSCKSFSDYTEQRKHLFNTLFSKNKDKIIQLLG